MKSDSKLPEINQPFPGARTQDIVRRDSETISPSYTRCYPLAVDHASGLWVWDADGNRFLDMTSGIAVCATGHCHPRVVNAIKEQADKFIHMAGTDFYYEVEVRLAETLNRLAPGDVPRRVFFANSGAEAVECAMKLVRRKTCRSAIIAFYGAFHGRTMGALSLTASKSVQRGGFQPLVPGIIHVPYGNCYRCSYRLTYPDCDLACVSAIEETVLARHTAPEEVAAIFVEPIQGEGGYVVPPIDWLPAIRSLCDRHGILLVVDEIQSGMGRTGRFWACEHSGVIPDILLSAKGIASGMPLGACIARSDLMDWPPGSHGTTFGGNPVSCAAALATIQLIEEGLVDNAAAVGNLLKTSLQELAETSPVIGLVSGLGLMTAVQIVTDKASHKPDPQLQEKVVDTCFHRGLLLLGCGESGIRFAPALTVTEEEAMLAVDILRDVLNELAG